ncbi:hypothetical protein CCACVL1_24794 [Corchorus capsularis]|uniref:Uncharacterized protein n=1 Tax=Corchorus capsularis TaxID=210143 RepID=A0A1R3GN40_COCAP|nr:hypothetical protein CCACVL1_24794 [Corchorus capsularis]
MGQNHCSPNDYFHRSERFEELRLVGEGNP